VVSYRTNDLDRAHPLWLLLAELERLPLVQRVELPRLSRRELIAQIRGILGVPGELIGALRLSASGRLG